MAAERDDEIIEDEDGFLDLNLPAEDLGEPAAEPPAAERSAETILSEDETFLRQQLDAGALMDMMGSAEDLAPPVAPGLPRDDLHSSAFDALLPMDFSDLAALQSSGGESFVGGGVSLEVESSGSHRRNHHSVVRFRLRNDTGWDAPCFSIAVSSELLRESPTTKAILSRGETLDFVVSFTPRVLGQFCLEIEVLVADDHGIPLQRCTGTHVVNVTRGEGEDVSPAIRAGGDVVIMGGSIPGVAIPDATPFDDERVHVDLAVDRNLERRIRRSTPSTSDFELHAEELPDPYFGPYPEGRCRLLFMNRSDGFSYALMASRSSSCVFGRGGKDDVKFWLEPAPYSRRDHLRMSSSHFRLTLRHGRAWVADLSSNGTWLNGERLARRRDVMLADGDRLSIAEDVMAARVRLLGIDGRVLAVHLRREDELGRKLGYVLTDGTGPWRLQLKQGLEVDFAWTRPSAGGAQLSVWRIDEGRWICVHEGSAHAIDEDHVLYLRETSSPETQGEDLQFEKEERAP